ncbi:hypothetical protein [Bacillus toyonensis]|uniref:hypothetical protein n=1 Tax=Bacillus toyonensis TaxID=155322 RepID=UPI001C0DB395|nr:hypothetical protein [Bacillus toyonensis]MBU4643117.1 hypothetical protein [Bacillus toyonensis]
MSNNEISNGDMGFFNKKEKTDGKKGNKKNDADFEYKEDVLPTTPYDPSIPVKAKLVNANKRATIQLPLETKQEIDALLEISEYQYAYEILGEMIGMWMKELTPDEHKLFHATLENIKRKTAIKEAKKKKK